MVKKAFLVGINDYPGSGSDLKGCANDVTNIRDILLKYSGFTVKEIRVLTDRRATKSNIMKRLEWLIDGAKAGDLLIFQYSGHGSQIRDRDGDELKDHLDEILCPYDMDWDGNFITDDELGALFKQLPTGVRLEVFLDSCHSGTGTRYLPEFGTEGERYVRTKFLQPPVDILCRLEDDLPVKRIGDFFSRVSANPVRKIKVNHILWAGCQDNQTSADAFIKGTYNGAFTYFLCKHVRDTGGRVNRSDLLKRLCASLRYEGYDQVPQLEGIPEAKKRLLFE
ncbi:MAG: caspase family protein [Nitrospirota bacterium]